MMSQLFAKFKLKNYPIFLLIIASIFSLQPASLSYSLQTTVTRYAPEIVSIVQSHEYLRNHESPLYWKLSAYYIPQRNDSSCSIATATMVINAALAHQHLFTRKPLATQNDILKRVNDEVWNKGVKKDGEGVSLAQLKRLLAKAFKAYGLNNFTIHLIYTTNSAPQNERVLQNYLLESETHGQPIIIVNFDQKFFTNDMSVGHFAPVGAYDAEKKRVLIMDPDREWYEPYWVPQKKLLQAMATQNTGSPHYRGYLIIYFKSEKGVKVNQ
ncbi:phytochelatin synthase family protein [Legionella jamestowniensis]|nr:phytochelatin synthase family protein [Legionella jamestowniensis]